MRAPAPVGATALAAGLLAAGLLAGCGAPAEGQVREIGPTEVPYGLLDPPPEPTADSSATAEAGSGPRVYFLQGDALLAVPLGTATSDSTDHLDALLQRLSAGPGRQERADGLSSALGTDVQLRATDLAGGTARVAVTGLAQNIAADRLPLAVGQVVLTATTAPGVDSVQLVRDGKVLEVPLPGGEQTAGPLTAADYTSLVGSDRTAPAS
ncbi:GerMN domain-containing protein [Kineococcus arenarius]|uniref:GerMN domain-containing protein n=1 Tax=unclassified Kineococcus TaxID=2621656 RepID=UPI003D7E2B06